MYIPISISFGTLPLRKYDKTALGENERQGQGCKNVPLTRSMLRKCLDNSIIEKTFIGKKQEEIWNTQKNEEGEM